MTLLRFPQIEERRPPLRLWSGGECRSSRPGGSGPTSRIGSEQVAAVSPYMGAAGMPRAFEVCLHGFMDTWRSWELVLPQLERHHDVLAPTLIGHAGGPPLEGELSEELICDAVEQAMDDADFETAHIVGNSLGGFVALQLAARGRAASVVAFAPAGGWARGDEAFEDLLGLQLRMHQQLKAAAPFAEDIVATVEGRRGATRLIATNFDHIPSDLLAHQIRGVARCDAVALLNHATRERYTLDPARIGCPVRVVWGTDDQLLPWPSAAARFRDDWLPHADWVELEGIGHCPQLDVPLVAAQLILGFTSD